MSIKDLGWLIFLGMLWGLSFVFMRVAAPEFGISSLMLVRTFGAIVVLLIPLLLRKSIAQIWQNWGHILVVGVLNTAVPYALFAYASIHNDAGFNSIINATVPFFGVIIVFFWLRALPSISGFFGMLIGFTGVFILIFTPELTTEKPFLTILKDSLSGVLNAEQNIWAIIAALTASLCYGFGTTYTKQYVSDLDPMAVAVGSQVFAGLIFLPFGIIFWPTEPLSHEAIGSAFAIATLSTGLALFIFYGLVVRIGAVNTMMVAFLIPVFGVLSGVLLLNEQLTTHILLGGGIVLLGVAIANNVIKLPFGK